MADKIAKKLPKRCSRAKGAWIQIHNGRNSGNRVLATRSARNGINGFDIGLVGSAAYRRRQPGRG